MGAFSANFLRAGQAAGRLLQGTLYERYYGVPYSRVLALDDVEKKSYGAPVSEGFLAICRELAGAAEGDARWSPAANGKIIEQAQIVTSHNLASVFETFGLAGKLPLPELARGTFEWICARHTQRVAVWRAELQRIKNTAYAWRQLVFYLSLAGDEAQRSFIDWSSNHLATQGPEVRRRLTPVVTGLRAICAGERFDADGVHAVSGGRRFLGWTVGRHWILPPKAEAVTASR